MDNPAARLRAALDALRVGIGRDLEVQALVALLVLAERGEASFRDVQEATGLSVAAISRNINLLSKHGYRNGPAQEPVEGVGLVETWENPMNRREKMARLTPDGKLLMRKVFKKMEG